MQGFEMTEFKLIAGKTDARFSLKRTTPGTVFFMQAKRESSEEQAESSQRTYGISPNFRGPVPASLPSELPIGTSVRVSNASKTVSANIVAGSWIFGFSGARADLVDRPPTVYPTEALQQDWQLVENLARRVIGRLVARDSESAMIQRVGSANVLTRHGAQSQVQLNLREWSVAKGYVLQLNDVTSVASMTVNAKPILIPLGSNSIKVGTQWINAPEVSMLHNGEWYVPKSLLDAVQ